MRPARQDPRGAAVSAAMRRSDKTGRPVTVAALTTGTTLVQANPDGLIAVTSNVLPVRVRRGPMSLSDRTYSCGVWKQAIAAHAVVDAMKRHAAGLNIDEMEAAFGRRNV